MGEWVSVMKVAYYCCILLSQIINEEHVATEEVMSQRSHDQCGEETRGREESDTLTRLRTESQLSGELTPPDLVSE